MAVCVKCDGLYPGRRKKIGYDTCLKCGEEEAREARERTAECSAPLYNKGPYGYVSSKKVAKEVGK